ncbi:MAG: fasciclin domain-containing protein [Candidatus Sericytochromatia bacterium]|nr:fasciclin domain-containing protein [Candidatus Sericytochromatia bacterium]
MTRTCKTLALLLPFTAVLGCGTNPTATQPLRATLGPATRPAAVTPVATATPGAAATPAPSAEVASAQPSPSPLATVLPEGSPAPAASHSPEVIVKRVRVEVAAPPAPPATVVDAALARPEFSTLVTLLRAAGLDATLRAEGPFTVFAPTNAAFDRLDPALVASLTQPANQARLAKVLRYHVLPGRLVAADIRAGQLATVLGPSVTLAATAGRVTVNAATVVATDVGAGNGVVHAIDQVLLPPTVVDLAVGAPSTFSTLVTALQETNLVSALQEGGLFTVFAPTNEAFAALGDALTILRKPWNRDLLAEVLKFHVLGAEKRAEALHTSVLPTLAEPTRPTLAVVRDGANLTAGGQAVATADLEAANGVVHVLSGVMLPPGFSVPPATVVDVAAGNADFSTLVQLVTAAGLGDALKADGPYTVFAPTNAAFAKLPPALVTALLRPENKAKLQQILTYHVVSAAVLARDLQAGAVTTLEGSAVQVALPTTGPTLNADVRVVATDVRAGNGVVHVIDSVLVPPTFVAP